MFGKNACEFVVILSYFRFHFQVNLPWQLSSLMFKWPYHNLQTNRVRGIGKQMHDIYRSSFVFLRFQNLQTIFREIYECITVGPTDICNVRMVRRHDPLKYKMMTKRHPLLVYRKVLFLSLDCCPKSGIKSHGPFSRHCIALSNSVRQDFSALH